MTMCCHVSLPCLGVAIVSPIHHMCLLFKSPNSLFEPEQLWRNQNSCFKTKSWESKNPFDPTKHFRICVGDIPSANSPGSFWAGWIADFDRPKMSVILWPAGWRVWLRSQRISQLGMFCPFLPSVRNHWKSDKLFQKDLILKSLIQLPSQMLKCSKSIQKLIAQVSNLKKSNEKAAAISGVLWRRKF